MKLLSDLGLFLARIFYAANFMFWGTQKFLGPGNIAHLLESAGLPGWLVYCTIVLQVGGGLLILLGFQTRLAAAALGWFCFVAPSIFWLHVPMNLTRDFSAGGGFILLLLFGGGGWSIDALMPSWPKIPLLQRPIVVDGGMSLARFVIALPLLTDAGLRILHVTQGFGDDAGYAIAAPAMFAMAVVEIVGGLAIIAGRYARLAALILIPIWLINALIFHMPPLRLLADDGLSVTKDFTLVAALLVFVVYGPGRWVLGRREFKGATDAGAAIHIAS